MRVVFLWLCLMGIASSDAQQHNPPLFPPAAIQKAIKKERNNFAQIIGNDPEAKIKKLFFPGNVDQAALDQCYNPKMANSEFNVFENNFADFVSAYYRDYPENFEPNNLQARVHSLFETVGQIATRTLDCINNPAKRGYQVGVTQISDLSTSEYKSLLGAIPDPLMGIKYRNRPVAREEEEEKEGGEEDDSDEDDDDGDERRGGNRRNKKKDKKKKPKKPKDKRKKKEEDSDEDDREERRGRRGGGRGNRRSKRQAATAVQVDAQCFPSNTSPLPQTFDYRSQGKVTPIKFQGTCGSCWAFSSLAALESAYLIKNITADALLDLSEQQVVACGNDQFCNGGTAVDAYNFMLLNKGVTGEQIIPYDFSKRQCETRKKKRQAKIKDYCLRGIYALVNGQPEQLTDEAIQQAIREFGIVYATINADHDDIKNFKSGVYQYDQCSRETNHAINIVGWDQESWIVRNSWGTKWGEDGFFRMKRGVNLCGLNTYITFPILQQAP